MAWESGNRFGRLGAPVTAALRRAALADDARLLKRAVRAALTHAARGSLPHLQWVADRLDGKVAQTLAVTHEDTRTLSLADVTALILQARSADAETIEAAPAIASSDGDDA